MLERISKLVVSLPLLHLTVCAIYLCGYMSTFGDGVSSLFAPSDIFSISFTGLATIYVSGLISGAFVLVMDSWLQKHVMQIAPSDQPATKSRSSAAIDWLFGLVYYGAISLMILSNLIQIYNERVNFPNVLIIGFLLLFAGVFFGYTKRHSISSRNAGLIWMSIIMVLNAFGAGMGSGLIDRFDQFSNLRQNAFGCKDYVVLRSIGTHYLAVRRDNRRLVIDDQCKTLFQFPVRPTFKSGPLSVFGLFQIGR